MPPGWFLGPGEGRGGAERFERVGLSGDRRDIGLGGEIYLTGESG